MRAPVVAELVAAVTLVGGVAPAVQHGESACQRYEAAVERDSYPSFEEQQREQARTLADCTAEKDQSAP